MTQSNLESCLGRLLTDAAFRLDFFSRPESTLAREELVLNEVEMRTLERIPISTLLELASHLDREVLRMSVPETASVPVRTSPKA